VIDDSALIHGGVYDPVKARAYYLRTRELKGRRPTTATASSPGRGGRRPATAPGKPNRSKTNGRQEELRAQKAALEKRLDRLREVLRELVDAAKKRSGVEDKSDSPAEKAEKNKSAKKDSPLTQKEKREKAKKAAEEYEKEHSSGLSNDVAELKRQVQDIRAKIESALQDAREKAARPGGPKLSGQKPGTKVISGPQQTTPLNSANGPKGR
jgi:hypothetical protein